MSGISRGSIFFTPALMILSCKNACENMVKFTLHCASGGILFNEKRDMRKERRITDGLSAEISELEKMVTEDINSQQRINNKCLDSIFEEITCIQKEAADTLKNNNPDDFKKMLIQSRDEINSKIVREAEQINKNYTNLINRNNAVIIQKISRLKESAIKEIESIKDDTEKKNDLARKRCLELTDSAEKLLAKTGVKTAAVLIDQAEKDAESGIYESGIALASSAITEIYMEIYRSDAREQEIQFYAQTGKNIAEEISLLLESIKETEFTNENGTSEIDLSQFMKGKYEVFQSTLEKEKNSLNNTENINAEEIKETVRSLTNLYSDISEACNDAFYLMTYSLQRNEMEKEIFGLLKEKGFSLSDTLFTDGDPSKASERTYKCELTGEELTISVIPYTDDENEIRTELIVSSSGNDCSEESREQYRQDIISKLKHDKTVENVTLTCVDETKNRNGADTGDKYRISSPEKIRRK